MAYVLDGQRLRLGRPFTHPDGRQFPANFLKLSTPQERDGLGIVEEPDPVVVPYDQRYFWGPDLPKRLDDEEVIDDNGVATTERGIRPDLIAQQKSTAGSLLSATDWYIVRKSETGVEVPAEVLAYRESVRQICDARELEISACLSTEELAALMTAPAQVANDDGEMVANPDPHLTPWP